jgi:hypothetical protein
VVSVANFLEEKKLPFFLHHKLSIRSSQLVNTCVSWNFPDLISPSEKKSALAKIVALMCKHSFSVFPDQSG